MRAQTKHLLDLVWKELDAILPSAGLKEHKTLGSRQNVFLAVATRAAYRVFLNEGVEGDYASELLSDVAWKSYSSWIVLPRFLAHLFSRDPQKQMNFILNIYLRYSFNEPGYQREVWEEPHGLCIYWYRCPPYEYFKKHGTPDEITFFRQTWCRFDWSLAEVMAPGGRYERARTLSVGDEVCDMKWSVGSLAKL